MYKGDNILLNVISICLFRGCVIELRIGIVLLGVSITYELLLMECFFINNSGLGIKISRGCGSSEIL